MVSALIVALGSRGDTEPCFALAKSMIQSGNFHRLDICIQAEYMHLVPSDNRIHIHQFSFSTKNFAKTYYYEYFKDSLLSFFTRNFDASRPSRRCIASIVKRFFAPELPFLHEIATKENPSLLIATTLGGPIVSTVAQQLNIPMWLINFQPTTPTTAYPYYMSGNKTAAVAGKNVVQMFSHFYETPENRQNIASYEIQQEAHKTSLSEINTYRSTCCLPSMDMSDVEALFSGRLENVYILNAFSPQLIPRSMDWTEHVHQVSALAADYIPSGWSPEKKCPKLKEYLSTAKRPICVSFGSMNVAEKKTIVTRELFKGLRATGINQVVLLKGNCDLGAHNLTASDSELKRWADDHVFFSDEPSQLAWLLPQCSGLICHGGAGTTSAGLRAGIPVVIAPLFCDQFFWGHVVQGRQLGSIAEPNLRDATADAYKTALKKALSVQTIDRVEKYSQKEKNACGSMAAAELFVSSMPSTS